MTYGESNGHVTDDGTWPQRVNVNTPRAQYRKQLVMPFRNFATIRRRCSIRSAILATYNIIALTLFCKTST